MRELGAGGLGSTTTSYDRARADRRGVSYQSDEPIAVGHIAPGTFKKRQIFEVYAIQFSTVREWLHVIVCTLVSVITVFTVVPQRNHNIVLVKVNARANDIFIIDINDKRYRTEMCVVKIN